MFADESTVHGVADLCRSGALRRHGGDCRLRQREWGRAADLMASSEAACRAAHQIQTALIGEDEGCGKITVNLILVHTRDHLMTAMLCQDLAKKLLPCVRNALPDLPAFNGFWLKANYNNM